MMAIRSVLAAGIGAVALFALAACGGQATEDAEASTAASEFALADAPAGGNGSVAPPADTENFVVGEGVDGHGLHYEAPPLETLGGTFDLMNVADGAPYTDQNLQGSWSLVYLGYMECEEACPIALKSLPAAVQEINAAGVPVKAVFIDVNAPRLDDMTGAMGHGAGESHAKAAAADEASGAHVGAHGSGVTGPEVRRRALKEWSKIYDPSIVMLSGSRKQILNARRIFQARVEQTMMPTKEVIHHLNHTTTIFVMDPEGKVAGLLYHSDPVKVMVQTVKELARPGSSRT